MPLSAAQLQTELLCPRLNALELKEKLRLKLEEEQEEKFLGRKKVLK